MKIKVGERGVHSIPRNEEREKRDNESRVIYLSFFFLVNRVIYLFTLRVKQNKYEQRSDPRVAAKMAK